MIHRLLCVIFPSHAVGDHLSSSSLMSSSLMTKASETGEMTCVERPLEQCNIVYSPIGEQ